MGEGTGRDQQGREQREALEELRRALEPLDIVPERGVEEGMLIFHPLLQRWSGRVRLVGSSALEDLALKHFADSLTLLPFLRSLPAKAVVVDIGSGAGFPGLPLALQLPELRFVLVEPDSRKAAFIAAAIAALGLENARVIPRRAEGSPVHEGIPLGHFVVSRALLDPRRWLPLSASYRAEEGMVAAMMGGRAPSDQVLEELGHENGLALRSVWRGTLEGAGKRVIACWAGE